MQNGKVFAFGKEAHGRLGVGIVTNPVHEPMLIETLRNVKIIGVASGVSHTLAWDKQGRIYSWGDATEGKLGFAF